ncbi:hypothetical protein [Nocardioides sp.]|uniref:hypothetical protein n=1 Tax=Nocardioides sp. TaxID=35761 RepID=UPI003D0F3BEC
MAALRGAVVLLLGSSLVAAGCTAADPETRMSVADPQGDVFVGGPNLGGREAVAAPGNARTDILRTTVEHGDDTVTLRVVLRELRAMQYLDVSAYVRTDRSGSSPWQLSALTYRRDSSIDLYGPGESDCPGLGADFDDATDTVTMTVPRSCLDDPAWVQVSVRAATMDYEARGEDRYADAVWEDDALQTGYSADTHYGPKLHHPES